MNLNSSRFYIPFITDSMYYKKYKGMVLYEYNTKKNFISFLIEDMPIDLVKNCTLDKITHFFKVLEFTETSKQLK